MKSLLITSQNIYAQTFHGLCLPVLHFLLESQGSQWSHTHSRREAQLGQNVCLNQMPARGHLSPPHPQVCPQSLPCWSTSLSTCTGDLASSLSSRPVHVLFPRNNNLLPVPTAGKPHSLLSSQLRCPDLQDIRRARFPGGDPSLISRGSLLTYSLQARAPLCSYFSVSNGRLEASWGQNCATLSAEAPESGSRKNSRVWGRRVKQGRQRGWQGGRWVAILFCCPEAYVPVLKWPYYPGLPVGGSNNHPSPQDKSFFFHFYF